MASWIVDASVVVKWFFLEADSTTANRLIFEPNRLEAPDLVLIELANYLRKQVRAGAISLRLGQHLLEAAPRVFNLLIPSSSVLDEALEIASSLGHPIYDCIYLAAARRSGAPLITADAAFAAKLAGTPDAGHIVLLADWRP